MNLSRFLLIAITLECGFAAEEPPAATTARPVIVESSADTQVVILPGAPVRHAEPAPVPERPKVDLPAAFQSDSSLYLQGMIGKWKKAEAQALLGDPVRERPASDNGAVNGRIYAYPDPSGRYRELELDFDSDSGALRTVFAYPKQLTWEECRKQWGGDVNTTKAQNGRSFYSYLNQKLDVLVDHGGKVISLGRY